MIARFNPPIACPGFILCCYIQVFDIIYYILEMGVWEELRITLYARILILARLINTFNLSYSQLIKKRLRSRELGFLVCLSGGREGMGVFNA